MARKRRHTVFKSTTESDASDYAASFEPPSPPCHLRTRRILRNDTVTRGGRAEKQRASVPKNAGLNTQSSEDEETERGTLADDEDETPESPSPDPAWELLSGDELQSLPPCTEPDVSGRDRLKKGHWMLHVETCNPSRSPATKSHQRLSHVSSTIPSSKAALLNHSFRSTTNNRTLSVTSSHVRCGTMATHQQEGHMASEPASASSTSKTSGKPLDGSTSATTFDDGESSSQAQSTRFLRPLKKQRISASSRSGKQTSMDDYYLPTPSDAPSSTEDPDGMDIDSTEAGNTNGPERTSVSNSSEAPAKSRGTSRQAVVKKSTSDSKGASKSKTVARARKAPSGPPQTETESTWKDKFGLAEDLPPMSDIGEIFEDITKNAFKDSRFEEALDHLGTRELRVATMCSGTESPMLALAMVTDTLKEHYNRTLRVNHLFSAEIVPYKQAYIDRNFKQTTIFRDIREIAMNDQATTAYGALVDVPGDIDLLVAGFSCVDFSRLNTWKKNLNDTGESGDTFRAILNYAKRNRPTIIVLENVLGAPWEDIMDAWTAEKKPNNKNKDSRKFWGEEPAYACHLYRPDTKNYYIPATRQRGYLVCIDKMKLASADLVVKGWDKIMIGFKRPASSPVEAFLLNEDDPRVHRGREELARGSLGEKKTMRDVNWNLCQGRHQNYREAMQLGSERPLTKWVNGGSCTVPDFWWRDWSRAQVERIWDTWEMSYLRNVVRGFDSHYKTRVWELSQNIDRNEDTTRFGLSGCITPTGQPFVTTRGGPLLGIEAITLQGLPTEKLILTRESSKQLQDLAGNAMTSTVVGPAILSALMVGYEALPRGPRGGLDIISAQPLEYQEADESDLKTLLLDLTSYKQLSTVGLLDKARKSVRLCICEGRTLTLSRNVLICKECKYTACQKCAGKPAAHAYVPYDETKLLERVDPQECESAIKQALPMRLQITGLTRKHLQGFLDDMKIPLGKNDLSVFKKDWVIFAKAVLPALGEELRFYSVKRSLDWTVYYEAPGSRLELSITNKGAYWRLYAKPHREEPANARVRQLLKHPFARMSVHGPDLLQGSWEFCMPVTSNFKVTIAGKGTKTRSWESKLGLQVPRLANKEVWNTLQVSVQPEYAERLKLLDLDINGDYNLLQDCGTASGSLHKKEKKAKSEARLYLFLDPDRIHQTTFDHFVFSTDKHRMDYGESRYTVARIDNDWRPSSNNGDETVSCSSYGRWIACKGAILAPFKSSGHATFAVPPPQMSIPIVLNEEDRMIDCHAARVTVLSCRIPVTSNEKNGWQSGPWKLIDETNERVLFSHFAWLTEGVRGLDGFSGDWRQLPLQYGQVSCTTCAPKSPSMKWRREQVRKTQMIKAYEDPAEATRYETSLKARPFPFVTLIRIDENNIGCLKIELNVMTLLHRALAKLAGVQLDDTVTLSWRLDTQYTWPSKVLLPEFTLRNNKNVEQAKYVFPQPNMALWKHQARSLQWMIKQEADDCPSFEEQEIEEVSLKQLGWRAEARATRRRHIRGGILADEVGYGKTAIILALVDCQSSKARSNLQTNPIGRLPLRATLILLPPTLTPQWLGQIEMFLGKKYKVMVIDNALALSKKSIKQFQAVDIVLVSWSLFKAENYVRNVSLLAALPEVHLSAKHSFKFKPWLDKALEKVADHTEEMKTVSSMKAFGQTLERKLEEATIERDNELDEGIAASKRLRGSQYVAQADANSKKRKREDSQSDEDLAPPGSIEPSEESTQTKEVFQPAKLAKFKIQIKLPKTPKTAKVTKPTKPKKPTKAKTSTSAQKVFGLEEGASLEDVKGSLLHMFHWFRIVVDEYPYLQDKDLAFVTSLKAVSRWVLSGTAPLDDFADVKVMAAFLGVDLGVDDDSLGVLRGHNIKAIRHGRTAAEEFQSFKEVHSPAWHGHRQVHAQSFLNQFCRRDLAGPLEIKTVMYLIAVNQAPWERAYSVELVQQVHAQDMRTLSDQFKNDRTGAVTEIISKSSSPDEALLKRCSHFTLLDQKMDKRLDKAAGAFQFIVHKRKEEKDEIFEELVKNLRRASWLRQNCNSDGETTHVHYDNWKNHVRNKEFGDAEITYELLQIIDFAEKNPLEKAKDKSYRGSLTQEGEEKDERDGDEDVEVARRSEDESDEEQEDAEKSADDHEEEDGLDSPSDQNQKSGDDNGEYQDTENDDSADQNGENVRTSKKPKNRYAKMVKELRDLAGDLRSISTELVSRTRALRYMELVSQVQLWQYRLRKKSPTSDPPTCARCGQVASKPSQLFVLSQCGHAACKLCLNSKERGTRCVVENCKATVDIYHVIPATDFGHNCTSQSQKNHYGEKIEKIIRLIQNDIPKDEQVLLFVQFEGLMDIVAKALSHHNISHSALTEKLRPKQAGDQMKEFQGNQGSDKKKVLVLNPANESAAGANLTNANHVIFFSPLLAPNQQKYDASVTQCIGRARRYGQKKDQVHVYRFVSLKSIDVDILEQREAKKLVERGGEFALMAEKDLLPGEENVNWGSIYPLESYGTDHRLDCRL